MFLMEMKDLHPSFNAQGAAKTLSLAEAMDVFDWLADMEDIAFNYPRNGCGERAHIMCRRLLERNHAVFKAWVFEEDGYLICPMPDGRKGEWIYHVAPVLPVRLGDKVEHLVFDPGLFDGPVLMKDWAYQCSCFDPYNHDIVPFGEAPKRGWGGDYTINSKTDDRSDDKAARKMFDYMKLQPSTPRRVYPSPLRDEIAAQTGTPRIVEGKTWISEPEYQRRNAPAPAPQEDGRSWMLK